MELKRDSKGRFTKGNAEGRKFKAGGKQSEIAAAGGRACQEKARERRTLREYFAEVLDEEVEIGGVRMSKLRALVTGAVNGCGKNPDMRDLKILFELAGLYSERHEIEGNVNTGNGIVVHFEEVDEYMRKRKERDAGGA